MLLISEVLVKASLRATSKGHCLYINCTELEKWHRGGSKGHE